MERLFKKKHQLLLLLLLLFYVPAIQAQDTLLTVQGQQLAVKLLHISENTIHYHLPHHDTATSKMLLSDVFMIKYGNGEKEVFEEHIAVPAPAKAYSAQQLKLLARQDARRYSKNTGTAVATGVISFLYLPVGLVMVLATKEPDGVYSNEVSDQALLHEQMYVEEYRKEVKRLKRSARFTGFAVGASAIAALIFMANSPGN